MDFLPVDATFEEKVIAYLSELDTKMNLLMGNGQPGIIADFEKRLKSLETSRARETGKTHHSAKIWAVGTSGAGLLIIEFLKWKFFGGAPK